MFRAGVNEFSDLTNAEFRAHYTNPMGFAALAAAKDPKQDPDVRSSAGHKV